MDEIWRSSMMQQMSFVIYPSNQFRWGILHNWNMCLQSTKSCMFLLRKSFTHLNLNQSFSQVACNLIATTLFYQLISLLILYLITIKWSPEGLEKTSSLWRFFECTRHHAISNYATCCVLKGIVNTPRTPWKTQYQEIESNRILTALGLLRDPNLSFSYFRYLDSSSLISFHQQIPTFSFLDRCEFSHSFLWNGQEGLGGIPDPSKWENLVSRPWSRTFWK